MQLSIFFQEEKLMDIDYLLLLQNFRGAINDFLSPFMLWLSDFSVSFWPIAIAAMIYWVFDRKAGKRVLAGFTFSIFANGLLKLLFRIPRPWIRDERVLPYGNSKVSATGFSFPSGHSTWATSLLGGSALWFRKRKQTLLCVVSALAMVLVMFSRNYLGVHTPQDVLTGFVASALMMFLASRLEDWTDRDPKRDLYLIFGGLAIAVAASVFYLSVPIEAVFLPDGTPTVEPVKMRADSFEGVGLVLSYTICRYFERRHFHFDTEKSWKDRFIIGVFALVPLYLFDTYAFAPIASISRILARLVFLGIMMFYIMIVVPFAMSKIHFKPVKE